MEWLKRLASLFGGRIGISFSVALPSFYKEKEGTGDMRQSRPSDFDEEGAEKLPAILTSRDFKHAHPVLVRRFLSLSQEFENKFPGKKLIVTCTYRSPEAQRELFKIGRFGNPGKIVTNCDGFNNKSDHNYFPARAMDVCVCVGGKPTWDESEYWPLVSLCKTHDLVSGGSWVKFVDWPHIGLPKEDA